MINVLQVSASGPSVRVGEVVGNCGICTHAAGEGGKELGIALSWVRWGVGVGGRGEGVRWGVGEVGVGVGVRGLGGLRERSSQRQIVVNHFKVSHIIY